MQYNTAVYDVVAGVRRLRPLFRSARGVAKVKHMAETGDMSVVSREYEKSIIKAWKNFVAGDIVRMV